MKNGFFVIKYDHCDMGYSSKINFDENPYDVMQLARNAITILDSLQIKRAHVIGYSMGGLVVQFLAINNPERIICMTFISSSTNSPQVPPTP